MHKKNSRLAAACLLSLLLISAACAPATTHTISNRSQPDSGISTLTFSAQGPVAGTYTLRTKQTFSKLRHGHKEFTIDLVDGSKTVFLVFYGYSGPGKYTLQNSANGGEVHINLGTQQTTWDLSMTPQASCSLDISKDLPTTISGLDRMQGSFVCPELPPGVSSAHSHPIAINNGYFDILIIVES